MGTTKELPIGRPEWHNKILERMSQTTDEESIATAVKELCLEVDEMLRGFSPDLIQDFKDLVLESVEATHTKIAIVMTKGNNSNQLKGVDDYPGSPS